MTMPPRLRRAESFLGIHFDFHAGPDCTGIGKTLTAAMVEAIIDQVRPDFIQCDCKGHPGLSSYPTKVGHPAPGFVGDPLRVWRDVTARRGVALYMHYSGVFDREAIRRHRSWARVKEDGKRDLDNTSVFGPYVDQLLIPQFKELCDVYGVDGVWVDGECWATHPDYHPKVLAAFRQATGIRTIPRKPEDPHYFEFLEFCREGFRRYLDRYVTALHEHNPNFQLASNWAYSSFMPEPVKVAVDFISGDYAWTNSLNSARLEARCMAQQGKPWDLMAWSFNGKMGENTWTTKTAVQLQQEAAAVLSVGGGFQAYFQQNRDGSIQPWQMRLMGEVARFCRERQAVCHRAKAVPQIGLIYCSEAFRRHSRRLFTPWPEELVPLNGILRALLDGQHSVEVLCEHHLTRRMQEYPLLILPEWEYLPPAFKRDLLAYVRGGGKLLVVGPKSAALFRRELRIRLTGQQQARTRWLEHEGWLAALQTVSQDVILRSGAKPFGRLYPLNDLRQQSQPAASIARLGRGQIAAVYTNFGERYLNAATSISRDFLSALVRQLFPDPLVEVSGSHHVDVAVNRTAGDRRLAINLLNTAGPHADPNVWVFDEIPAVGPLHVLLRLPRRPNRITLEPGAQPIAHHYRDGEARLVLPRLDIHSVLVVE